MSKFTLEQLKEQLAGPIGEMLEKRYGEAALEVQKQIQKDSDERILKAVQEMLTIQNKKTFEEVEATEIRSGYETLSEFAIDVYKSELNLKQGRPLPEKLQKYVEQVDKVAKTVGSPSAEEGDSVQGGYLVPQEFRAELYKLAVEKSEILARTLKIPMQTNSVAIPYISGFDHSSGLVHGNVLVYWLDELEGKTAKKPYFGKISLTLNKLAGLCYSSDELLEDSPISMEPLFKQVFADAFTFALNNAALNGTGAGQILGILNAPCTVSVAKEINQAPTTIIADNIFKMYARLWRKSGAIWLMNHDCFPQLAKMGIAVGTGGGPVFIPAGGISGKPYNTLMGLPIVETEHCQTLGTVGDIILCDWSQYLVGEKVGRGAGMQYASSIHLKFDYDQTAYRFVYRIDGQPWWPSAMTPRYSSDTLSPFITLATRS